MEDLHNEGALRALSTLFEGPGHRSFCHSQPLAVSLIWSEGQEGAESSGR